MKHSVADITCTYTLHMSGIAMISSSSSIQWAVTQIINKGSTCISSEKVVTKLPQESNLVPFNIVHFQSTLTFILYLCPHSLSVCVYAHVQSSVQSTTISSQVQSSRVESSPVVQSNVYSPCKSHEINILEN